MSDIDTTAVDSLKALDPERPIREADIRLGSDAPCPSQLKCSNDIEFTLTRSREIIDLPSSGGKRILDGYLNMLVPCVVRRRVVDDNVFVRRNCKPDMDLEPGTVTMLVTRRDHSHTASDDAAIVFLQPVYLMIDYGARSLRRLGSFERHFQWDLHNGLSSFEAAAKQRINRTVGRGRNPCS